MKTSKSVQEIETWTYRKGHAPHFQCVIWPENDGRAIAVIFDDETESKARLIATAPELALLAQHLSDDPYLLTPDQWASEARQLLVKLSPTQ